MAAHEFDNSSVQVVAMSEFDNSVQAVTMSGVLNFGLLAGQLCIFGLLLGQGSLKRVLAPRLGQPSAPAGPSLEHIWLPWGWALKALREHKKQLADDLDALAMLRFCVLGLKFSCIGSIVAVVLIPFYRSGHGRALGFNAFNVSNLQGNGEGFWLVVCAAYVLVGAFLHFAVKEWHLFLALRRAHFERLACGKRGPEAAQAVRSVIVEFIPPESRQQNGSGVRRFFEQIFPSHGVHSCVLQPDMSQIRPDNKSELLQVRQAMLERGEDAGSSDDEELQGASSPAQRPAGKDWEGWEGVWENVLHPAGDLAVGVVDRTRQAAEIMQDLALGRASGSDTAFVTLRSVADRVVAEQLVISHRESWRVRAAPEVRDVVWPNVAVPLAQTRHRSLVTRAGLILGIVFWSVPVSSIQAWTSLDEKDVSWVRGAFGMILYTFVRDYVPVLAFMLLQYMVPFAIHQIAKRYERFKLGSELQKVVLRRSFYYQLATVYVTVVAGTVSQTLHGQLREISHRPSALLEILRAEVPAVACYFVSYVTARIGISLPMLLLWPLVAHIRSEAITLRALCGLLRAATCRRNVQQAEKQEDEDQHEEVPQGRHTDLSGEAANLGMVLVLGLTYCVVAPSIMPLCMIYFAFAFLVYCWLFLYVYTPQLDLKGECWYELFNGAMIGLDLGAISLAALARGFVGLGSPHFYALLVLFFLVVAFHFCFYVYRIVPSRVLSVEDAHAVDKRCDPELVSGLLRSDYYLDPVLADLATGASAAHRAAFSAASARQLAAFALDGARPVAAPACIDAGAAGQSCKSSKSPSQRPCSCLSCLLPAPLGKGASAKYSLDDWPDD